MDTMMITVIMCRSAGSLPAGPPAASRRTFLEVAQGWLLAGSGDRPEGQ
jgi:hypothetical protein